MDLGGGNDAQAREVFSFALILYFVGDMVGPLNYEVAGEGSIFP